MRYNANPVGLSLLIRAHQRREHAKYPVHRCPMCRTSRALAIREAVATPLPTGE